MNAKTHNGGAKNLRNGVADKLDGGLEEAPIDGSQYARKDAAWEAVVAPVVGEAPIDGSQYARKDAAWEAVVAPAVGEAPEDGTPYARQDAGWVAAGGGGAWEVLDTVPNTTGVALWDPDIQGWFALGYNHLMILGNVATTAISNSPHMQVNAAEFAYYVTTNPGTNPIRAQTPTLYDSGDTSNVPIILGDDGSPDEVTFKMDIYLGTKSGGYLPPMVISEGLSVRSRKMHIIEGIGGDGNTSTGNATVAITTVAGTFGAGSFQLLGIKV